MLPQKIKASDWIKTLSALRTLYLSEVSIKDPASTQRASVLCIFSTPYYKRDIEVLMDSYFAILFLESATEYVI